MQMWISGHVKPSSLEYTWQILVKKMTHLVLFLGISDI